MMPHVEQTSLVGAEQLAHEVVGILDELFPARQDAFALHEPEFSERAEATVVECIRSTFVSSVGAFVSEFEARLADYCGAAHAVAMVNGTAALEVALRVAGVESNSEVLLPSLTFVATPNAISHLNAVPHFVDINEQTLGIDPLALRQHLNRVGESKAGQLLNRETGRRIAAVVPVHVFGHPVEMDELVEVADDFGIAVIEDAAEALGSQYKGRHCAAIGLLGAVSFNGNKIITTGGGGAVLTNDPNLAAMARHLSTTAKRSHPWAFEHDSVGYNYRMPNLNAALGVSQLEELPDRIARKRQLAAAYIDRFAGHPDLRIMKEPEQSVSNYWLNTLLLEPHAVLSRDVILQTLNDAGFMARPVWEPMHTLSMYADSPRALLPNTESLAERIINLPSSAKLAELLQ
jgi:perosamine synthetase